LLTALQLETGVRLSECIELILVDDNLLAVLERGWQIELGPLVGICREQLFLELLHSKVFITSIWEIL